LFVCLVQYLDSITWNDKESILKKGDEVSTFSPEKNSYMYGEVVAQTGDTVEVKCPPRYSKDAYKDESITLKDLNRNSTHKRTFITEPLIVFSDDKSHDTYFVQKFFESSFFDEDGWFKNSLFNIRDRFKHLLINSDGAASHFKQKYTLQFLCKLSKRLKAEGWKFKRIVWLLGCPGHGKGVWDGLGGVIKNTLRSRIIKSFIIFGSGSEG